MLQEFLSSDSGIWNLLNYITFRAGAATVTAFLVSIIIGPWVIEKLAKFQEKGQPIRDLPLEAQDSKQGTPTMGGLLIWVGILVATVLWIDLSNAYVWAVLFISVSYGIVGFMDDLAKVRKHSSVGISARMRLSIEFIVAAIGCAFIMGLHGAHTPDGCANWGFLEDLSCSIANLSPKTSVIPNDASFAGGVAVPFINDYFIPLGLMFVLFGMIVVVGSANAVNFTDGLDGLAIVPIVVAGAAFALIAYLTGNFRFSEYLGIQFTPGSGEIAVLLGAMLGAGLGFLWYNAYPARLFMGDTGSLSLGGLIGIVAVATKHEFALAVIGGLFVIEALSVMLQVTYFKYTRYKFGEGKRIFLMAPLHHHFQMSGWPESKIVVRFWILSLMFALAGLATLKLR